jgi:hypothetical protein
LIGMVAVAGGLSWLAKLGVIVATGGDVVDTGAAAVFYLLGASLLALGGILTGLWLTSGRVVLLRIAGGILGLLGFFAIFFILDAIGQEAVGNRGPDYVALEAGIFLTALSGLVAGAWLWLRGSRSTWAEPAI